MPDSWATAVIGAVGSVVGAAMPVAWTWYRETAGLYRSELVTAVSGTWLGEGTDPAVDNDAPAWNFTLRLELVAKGRRVRGAGILAAGDTPIPKLTCGGGFYAERVLRLGYRSAAEMRKQAGVILLRLSDDGARLSCY